MLHDRREVVYVGQVHTGSLGGRMSNHTKGRLNGRWDRFSWFGIYRVNENGSLDKSPSAPLSTKSLIGTMEALLIEGLEPRQNRKREGGFNAIEYIQVAYAPS